NPNLTKGSPNVPLLKKLKKSLIKVYSSNLLFLYNGSCEDFQLTTLSSRQNIRRLSKIERRHPFGHHVRHVSASCWSKHW
ncbi:MAG: hypothetical protein ACREBR_00900, partial [bacterium]